jgi:hypothetical protein
MASAIASAIASAVAHGNIETIIAGRDLIMKKQVIAAWGALSGSLVAITMATSSFADPILVPESTAAPSVSAEQTTYHPPNRALIVGGLVSFVGAYVPSVLVAASNNNSYDHKLYIPVAGPWMDLAQRPGACNGFAQPTCGRETAFNALLIINGAFQGLGALATVLGFVVPEKHRTTVITAKADKPTVHIVPAQVSRDGYGLAAFGDF